MNLVIVESPAKARTIGAYLGKDYVVLASMGHVRDLPKSGKGVDAEKDFLLDYQVIKGKEKMIEELLSAAGKADMVYLATDPDREGEAISWHLKEILNLPDDRANRVTFNEITKKEVLSSIKNPRKIDLKLVDAQQARRALDRIVGYEVSPILWRKIKSRLSAGRVQSVACRMVVERENEIRAFIPEEYWNIEAELSRVSGSGSFIAAYFGFKGGKKRELKTEEEAMGVLSEIKDREFNVLSVVRSQKKRSPAPPFTTSTLQQEASRKLGMSPKRCMAVAQQLYEGIDVEGHGLTGLITYMRTDSLRLSEEAVTGAREFIENVYGKEYLPKEPRVYKSKSGAQDAHEAIRPSYTEFPPDSVKSSLTPDQFKLYKLIWGRFISCQMENAVMELLTIDSVCENHVFRANHTSVKFPGYTAVYEEGTDSEDEAKSRALPKLDEGEALKAGKFNPTQHFTKPPSRYSEAALIRMLEEKGIGRPSTYAPTISTIMEREYVLREGKQLRPTPLGEAVTSYMVDKFNDIVDETFTARMETTLDDVEEGRKEWKAMLREFYGGFSQSVKAASEDSGRVKVPDEPTDFICENCGRPMFIRHGRFGRYIACEGYPNECKTTRPVSEETPGLCPLCNAKILKKKSKRGYTYFGCEKNPSCGFMTWDTPLPETCPECGKSLFKCRYIKEPCCENPECSLFVPEEKRKRPERKSSGDSAASAEEKDTKKEGKSAKTKTEKKTEAAAKKSRQKKA